MFEVEAFWKSSPRSFARILITNVVTWALYSKDMSEDFSHSKICIFSDHMPYAIFHNNHVTFMMKVNINAYQVAKSSFETTLIRLTKTWRAELDSKKIVAILSSDMSKAFDSLSPQLLINKLQAYNFSDKAIQLIQSYFQGRENRVRIGSITIDWVVVKRGCPQGSTFGPLMWNIFQNDMPNIISDANVSLYADDHQVFVANETTKSVEKILVDNGERMTKWYQDNLLKVHCDKYQAMVLGNPKGERNVDLDVCGEKVEQSESIKILGLNLDENLNFRDHTRSVCKKIGGMIGILRRLKNRIPVNAMLLL